MYHIVASLYYNYQTFFLGGGKQAFIFLQSKIFMVGGVIIYGNNPTFVWREGVYNPPPLNDMTSHLTSITQNIKTTK